MFRWNFMKSGRKNLKMEKSTKMRYRGIMFEIDRTDFQILTAFKVVDEETVIILDRRNYDCGNYGIFGFSKRT